MDELDRVDARSLERRAGTMGDGEAVIAFLEFSGVRAVAGVRLSDDLAAFFIEVTSSSIGKANADHDLTLDRGRQLDRALRGLGFSSFDDDLDRIWELATSDRDLAIDLDRTRKAIAGALEADRPDPLGQ